ncbi:MAG: DUF2007 domain-containing protein [Gemmataceae bacterium]|nr:DUF2007 domain-containing protein [Gemmataceae bacterium]
MAHENLVTVAAVGNPVKAEIIKNALEAEGIRCFLEQEDQAALSGLMGVSVKIQVPEDQAEQARRFIADREQSAAEEESEADADEQGEGEADTGIREGLE